MLSLLSEFVDFTPKGWYEKDGKYYGKTKSGKTYRITPDMISREVKGKDYLKQMGYAFPPILIAGLGAKYGIQYLGDFHTHPLDPNYVFTPPFLGMIGGSYIGTKIGQKWYHTNLLNRVVEARRNAKS